VGTGVVELVLDGLADAPRDRDGVVAGQSDGDPEPLERRRDRPHAKAAALGDDARVGKQLRRASDVATFERVGLEPQRVGDEDRQQPVSLRDRAGQLQQVDGDVARVVVGCGYAAGRQAQARRNPWEFTGAVIGRG
jgi:hypothetical protein